MKQNPDPIHSDALRRALQSMPPTGARLPSNFTWRTMQDIFDVAAIRQRRQERYARIIAIAACAIAGTGAITLAAWLYSGSIGSALKANFIEVGKSFSAIPPVLIIPATVLPLLLVADRLLRHAYFRRK